MRIRRLLSVGVVTVLISAFVNAGTDLPLSATQTFVKTTHPTWKAVYEGRKLVALVGGDGIENNTAHAAAVFVENTTNDNRAAFGIYGANDTESTLHHKETRILNSGKTVYTYTQKVHNVHVHGSSVKVVADGVGTIQSILLRTASAPYPASFPADVLTEAEAKAVISNSPKFDVIETFGTGIKVVVEAAGGTLKKVWRFTGWGGGRSYQFFVDTNSGAIVAAIDGSFQVNVSGQVKARSTTNLEVFTGSNLTAITGLPGVRLETTTSSQCQPGSSVATEYSCPDSTDNPPPCDNGAFAFTNVSHQHFVSTTLDGRWARARSCHECSTCNRGSCTESATAEDFGLWSLCGDVQDQGSWQFYPTFDPGNFESTEYDVAQVNAFLAIEQTHDWFADLLPEPFLDIDVPVTAAVNAHNETVMCGGGNYDRVHRAIAVSAAFGPCRNTSMKTIVTHEYGHFIVDAILPELLGAYIRFHDVNPPLSFHEGAGDTVMALMWDTPCNGKDVHTADPDGDGCVRNIDPAGREYSYYDPHAGNHLRGAAMAGAFWDLRKSLLYCEGSGGTGCNSHAGCNSTQICVPASEASPQLGFCRNKCNTSGDCGTATCTDRATEELFADFLFNTSGNLDGSILYEVLAVDSDTDDNIINGTLNRDQIYAAFSPHGWDDGTGDVHVDWVGPITGPPNEQAGDFSVDNSYVPPLVTLKTTAKGNPSLAVERWFVGRRHPTTGEGLNIWAVTDQWNGSAGNVIVRVGKGPDSTVANHRAGGLGLIEIDQPGSFFSNIELFLERQIEDVARCMPDSNGKGGRISGKVGGDLGRVEAQAIGTDDDVLGTLDVGGMMRSVSLDEHASDTSVKSKLILDSLGTDPQTAGTIDIADQIDGDIIIRMNSAGTIDGGTNNFLGKLLTCGAFNGQICAANLVGWHTNPNGLSANIKDHAVFGKDALICGTAACASNAFPSETLAEATDSPHPKSRFISVAIRAADPEEDESAIRVLLSSLHRVNPPYNGGLAEDFSSLENDIRWVGPPALYNEHSGGGPSFHAAKLQCTPYYHDWSSIALLHVTGSAIVPSSEYVMQMVKRDESDSQARLCGAGPAIKIKTGRWADVEAPFNPPATTAQPDATDFGAVVNKFRGDSSAPIKARSLLFGGDQFGNLDITPDLSFSHISACIDAFRGKAYPFTIEGCE